MDNNIEKHEEGINKGKKLFVKKENNTFVKFFNFFCTNGTISEVGFLTFSARLPRYWNQTEDQSHIQSFHTKIPFIREFQEF